MAASVFLMSLATLVWLSGEDMLLGLMLVIVVLGWGLLFVYGVISSVRAARQREDRWASQQLLGWLGGVLALTVLLVLGFAGAPEKVRFRLSRDALVDAGERVLAGEHPTRAALYGFELTTIVEGCAMLRTGTAFIAEFGWAYCPTGRPALPGFEHVEGALYTYDWD